MIPKIIHLCWISSDPYPEKVQKCLNSWKKYLPDYEIILWDTKRLNIEISTWTKQAFERKAYAFIADYVRFYALYNYGGIYLDSDVEILKSFDSLLHHEFFFGYEYTAVPEAAVVGAVKGLCWIKACLDWYMEHDFIDANGNERRIVAPLIMKYGFEKVENCKLIDHGNIENIDGGLIFPYNYFSCKNSYNDQIIYNENSFAVHHFTSNWLKKGLYLKFKRACHKLLIKVIGKYNYNIFIYKFRSCKKL